MKKTIKISSSVSGVIATGSYQNLRPGYSWEETIEDCDLTDDQIQERIKDLYAKAYSNLKEAEQKAIAERIKAEREDLRIRTSPVSGKAMPSVTSIISYDADFFVSGEDLRQYASQGNITHAKANHYIEKGEWTEAKNLNDLWTDIIILSKGSLGLSINSGDFPAFLKEYPIEKMTNGEVLFNEEDCYSGEPDFTGHPIDWKGAENKFTLFDIKRTVDDVKAGMQLAAYCKVLGITQAVAIPLNNKTKQGYSKPTIYDEVRLDGYYKMFLKKRKSFKARYSI